MLWSGLACLVVASGLVAISIISRGEIAFAPVLPILAASLGPLACGLLGTRALLIERAVARTLTQRMTQRSLGAVLSAIGGVGEWLLLGFILGETIPLAGSRSAMIGAIILALLSFVLLVGERTLAAISPVEVPEAKGLQRLIRLPILAMIAIAIALGMQSQGFGFASLPLRLAAAILIAVSVESILRGMQALCLPPISIAGPSILADSLVAGLVTGQPSMLPAAGQSMLKERFGVDLSRSWALLYARQAALPLIAAIAVLGWLLTGVRIVDLDQRAVYERLGLPVAILQPGLHLTLPEPLGRVRRLEVGVVHQMTIGFGGGAGLRLVTPPGLPIAAEAPTPKSEDRLWDQSHASDATVLVDGAVGGQQGFAVLEVDASLLYRVGSSDKDAMRAVYAVEAPEQLLRAHAGQAIARYFAQTSLDHAISANRDRIEAALVATLQAEMASVGTGIEVLAVVIEALHPPAAAAPAYQGVQAAKLISRTNVDVARSTAVTILSAAQSQATAATTAAEAAGAEATAAARVQAIGFAADRDAYEEGRPAFLLERYLAALQRGLDQAELMVVDPGLAGENAPLIDLRGGASTLPRRDITLTPPAPTSSPDGSEEAD